MHVTTARDNARQPQPCRPGYWRRLHASESESSADDDSSSDWLSDLQSAAAAAGNDNADDGRAAGTKLAPVSPQQEEEEPPEDLGNNQIPSTGISVTDELEKAQTLGKFESQLVPITGLENTAAQIVTSASNYVESGLVEPVRYLISLSPPPKRQKTDRYNETFVNNDSKAQSAAAQESSSRSFVMVDIPPFSKRLLADISKFMKDEGDSSSASTSRLVAMVITSRDGIHYDDAPAIYSTLRSDLAQWTNAFPDAQVIGYRLDIPRDCRDMITQRLDGYGPWALEEPCATTDATGNVTFVETGRPLTYEEWDADIAKQVMEQGSTPPDDDDQAIGEELDDDALFTPGAIRDREEGKRLLAVYTPGHTFGSLTFVFPEIQACCSGYTIPIEDDRFDETLGMGGGGPAMDFRGYITTSKAGMSRMMESARQVVDTYSDRFTAILPSRGDPVFVDGSVESRREALNDIIDKYDKIGKIYEKLGITLPED